MGRYLNAQTREDVVIIAGIIDTLTDIANRWNNNMKNPPKKIIKFLRTAASFNRSAMKELDKDLDNSEVSRIYRMAETTKFNLNYTRYTISSKCEETKTYDITEDERDSVVEALAQVRCNGCNGTIKDCVVRGQFFKWDIEPIYELTDKNHPCQYMSE